MTGRNVHACHRHARYGLVLPSGAFALKKGSSKHCTIKDSQTRSGSFCVSQAGQHIATEKS